MILLSCFTYTTFNMLGNIFIWNEEMTKVKLTECQQLRY